MSEKNVKVNNLKSGSSAFIRNRKCSTSAGVNSKDKMNGTARSVRGRLQLNEKRPEFSDLNVELSVR